MNAILDVAVRVEVDSDPDTSYLDEPNFLERLESYRSGSWTFVGVTAVALIRTGDVTQRVTSGGLWGIESDSGSDYLESVGAGELDSLVEILRGLGFSAHAVSEAYAGVSTSWC